MKLTDLRAETIDEPTNLIDALKKLSATNLSNLTPHPFYVFINYSHPTLSSEYRQYKLQRVKIIPSIVKAQMERLNNSRSMDSDMGCSIDFYGAGKRGDATPYSFRVDKSYYFHSAMFVTTNIPIARVYTRRFVPLRRSC